MHLSDDTLLSLADGELPPGAADDARAHVAGCGDCAARLARFERVSAELSAGLAARRRRTVRVVIAVALTALGIYWINGETTPFPRLTAAALQTPSLPVRHLTPGAVRPVTAAELCVGDDDERPAEVPEPVRRRVLRDYGARDLPDSEYELDYLITPSLGGAPDPQNLWPERYHSPTWNAHVKDELEDLLRHLVCAGTLPLASAQRDIAGNWIAAYKRYFHTQKPGGWPDPFRRPLPSL